MRDLICSFKVEAPPRPVRPPSWDLTVVLQFLNSSTFEPLHLCSLWNLTKKVLVLVSLATAKRVEELQTISRSVSFVGPDACLPYVPEFVAKTESFSKPLPRSFFVKSLADFAAGLEDDLLLYPVRALRVYLRRTGSISPPPRLLFVSPRVPSCSLSKNGVSFFLWEVIRSSMSQGLLGWKAVLSGPMTFAESLLPLPSTGIGSCPVFWRLLPGGPIPSSLLFIFVTSNTNLLIFVLWVRSWLQGNG